MPRPVRSRNPSHKALEAHQKGPTSPSSHHRKKKSSSPSKKSSTATTARQKSSPRHAALSSTTSKKRDMTPANATKSTKRNKTGVDAADTAASTAPEEKPASQDVLRSSRHQQKTSTDKNQQVDAPENAPESSTEVEGDTEAGGDTEELEGGQPTDEAHAQKNSPHPSKKVKMASFAFDNSIIPHLIRDGDSIIIGVHPDSLKTNSITAISFICKVSF